MPSRNADQLALRAAHRAGCASALPRQAFRATVCYLGGMSRQSFEQDEEERPQQAEREQPHEERAHPEVKVVDRRWWARGESGGEPAPSSKPTYVEELEGRLAEKDKLLQSYIEQYKAAQAEFEQARQRTRRDVAREVERGRREFVRPLLDVLDNLDRALDAGRGAPSVDAVLDGIALVRQQFLAQLEAAGVQEIPAAGEPFDPTVHEAVSIVPVQGSEEEDRVAAVVRRGYRMGDEVVRPAMVTVTKK
jgi:molecular chaperone GrpE